MPIKRKRKTIRRRNSLLPSIKDWASPDQIIDDRKIIPINPTDAFYLGWKYGIIDGLRNYRTRDPAEVTAYFTNDIINETMKHIEKGDYTVEEPLKDE